MNKNILYAIPILILLIGIGIFFAWDSSETQEQAIPLKVIDLETQQVEREILLKNPRYVNGDLDAIFEEQDFNEEVLDFQLKSHPNVNHVKQVGAGNQVVMYYDVNSIHFLENALGNPEFIDMKTGELVERDWRYVIWGNETRERQVCSSTGFTTNGTETCLEYTTENYEVETWLPYESRNLNGKQRIGIEVEVKLNDHIDGVWNVGGKKISRHAEWEANLEAGLLSWWSMNTTGVIDYLGNYNGTNNGTTVASGVSDITNNSLDFESTEDDSITFSGTESSNLSLTGDEYSIAFWMNVESNLGITNRIINKDDGLDHSGGYSIYLASAGNLTWYASGGSIQSWTTNFIPTNSQWTHVVLVFEKGVQRKLYIDGNEQDSSTDYNFNIAEDGDDIFEFGKIQGFSGQRYDGLLDEVAIWDTQALNSTQVVNLYNEGLGCTYQLCDAGLSVTLLSPEDNANLTSSSVNFIVNVSDPNSVGIQNVTANVYFSNGTLVFNETNSSGFEGNYTFSTTLADGDYDWNSTAYDDSNVSYDSGTFSFTIDTEPQINVGSPVNGTTFTSTNQVNFNATSDLNISNWIINYNGTNVTVSDQSGTTLNQNLTVEDGNHNLLLYGENNESGIFGLNNTISFSVNTAPDVSLNSPSNNTLTVDQVVLFNATVTQNFDVDSVELFLDGVSNGTNSSGFSGEYIFNRTLPFGNYEWYVIGNSSNGGSNQSETRTITISPSSLNEMIYNTSTFETASETFTANVTTNEDVQPTNSILTYDGDTYTATVSDGNDYYLISSTIDIPTGVENKTFSFSYNTGSISDGTSDFNQTVQLTILTLLNSTYDTPFINLSFRNETTNEESVNASIPSSSWTYYLGSGGVKKEFTFSNSTENLNYTLAASPTNRTLFANTTTRYTNSESQQRTFISNLYSLSNSTTQQVLYLLPTDLGLFSPFQVIDNIGDAIGQVSSTITRTLNSQTITVAKAETDDSGFVTFFLNPDVTYTGEFSKTGFQTETFSFSPTTETRTVVLGGGGSNIANGTQIGANTTYSITPTNQTLLNNTVYQFGFNVTSSDNITFIGFEIRNSSGFSFLKVNDTSQGFISGNFNTSSNTTLVGYFTIESSTETIEVTRIWIVGNFFVGDYSIYKQFTLYHEYGFTDFFRLLIVLITLIAVLIFMSGSQVIDSQESRIMVTILLVWGFSIVGWLDTGLVVSSANESINLIGELSNQYGIAIVSTAAGLFFVLRRVFN